MSSEGDWQFSELGKEAINASRPFSFKTHPQVIFINTGDVLDGKLLHANISAGNGLPGQAKKSLRKDDILLTEIRPGNGRFAFVNFEPEKYVVSTKFMVIESLGRVSPRFLYHVLTNQASLDEFQHIAESRSGTFPQITFDSIAHFPIPIPSKQEQAALVEFLDSVQKRIELLRETNATLEAIAQALFKSWFVDFDPVHANRALSEAEGQQGRAPEGLDEAIPVRSTPAGAPGVPPDPSAATALFPDSFEESELGLVPRGWKHSTVGHSFILTMGQSPPGHTYNSLGDGLPFYQGRTDFGLRFPTKRVFCNAPTRTAEIGDTLVSVRAPVGDVNMAIERCCLGRGVASVRHPQNFRSFAFYAIRGLRSKFDMYDSEGTVFGSINKKDFQALPVIEPTKEVLKAFDDIAAPLDGRIVENEEIMRTLATLRDTLLPRLISGQLRLPEAEAMLEEA